MPRKILNVGRVKGSMWYSGTNPQEVQKPLEGDLYLDKESSKIFIFKNNVWEETTDFDQLVKDTIKENSNAIDSLKIATSSDYDIDSDKQIPTTKTVKGIVDDAVPTKASELTNDKGYIDSTVNNLTNYYLKTQTYTKDEVLELIGKISTLSLKVVSSLPTTNISTNTIYLQTISSTEEQNVYEEYIYVNNKWELIGSTKVNLEGLVTEEQLTSSINSATANFVTEEIVNQTINSKLSSVPTEESIDAKINNAITSLLANKY